MSNDVLKDGFFADKEISASEKLALCALSLGGTYSEQVTQDGRNTVLFSMVYKKCDKKVKIFRKIGLTFGVDSGKILGTPTRCSSKG